MHTDHNNQSSHNTHYRSLIFMAILSFICMYILMYAMVDTFGNVYSSFNQFYMAGLMTMPMIVIELVMMHSMYTDKRLNSIILIASTVAGIIFFVLIRQQTAISDRQFLRSMIPHHAGAILMCEQASLEDSELQTLCQNIISGQQAEIDLMKAKLNEGDN